MDIGTADQLIGCTCGTCGGCGTYSLSLGTDTTTERTFTLVDESLCGGSVTGTITVTLSDECIFV